MTMVFDNIPLLISLFHYYFLGANTLWFYCSLVRVLIEFIFCCFGVFIFSLVSVPGGQRCRLSWVFCPISLSLGRSVSALRMLVTVQFRINMCKRRGDWDEARTSHILWKLQMFKGDVIYCLLSFIRQVFIEHLLCVRSRAAQWRYKLRESIGRKDTVISENVDSAITRDTYLIYSTQKRENCPHEGSGKAHWERSLRLVLGKMWRDLPRRQKVRAHPGPGDRRWKFTAHSGRVNKV